jgi:hypothetical protein
MPAVVTAILAAWQRCGKHAPNISAIPIYPLAPALAPFRDLCGVLGLAPDYRNNIVWQFIELAGVGLNVTAAKFLNVARDTLE